MDTKKISMAKSLVNDSNNSIKDICETLNVSRAILYRHLKESNESEINLK
jgi:predicted transcriptional regulator YheO